MNRIFGFLVRLVFFMAGLAFALFLLALTAVLLLLWGLRVIWGRMTGQPVQPLVFTVLRRSQFFRPRAGQDESEIIDVEAHSVSRTERINR